MPRNQRHFVRVPRLAAILLGGAAPGWAGFTAPAFVSHHASPSGEFAGWESFVSPELGSNPPDDPATSPGAAFDIVQLNAGAILTGGNLYSFVGPTSFILKHAPSPALSAPDLARLSLQISTLGNELDYGSVRLEYVDAQGVLHLVPYDARAELARSSLGSFGWTVETLFEWDLAGLADAVVDYRVLFESAAPHMSLDAVLLDALWSDEPFGYCAPQSAGCAPLVGWAGSASASSGAPFWISATGAPAGQNGLLFYGVSGAKQTPFKGGYRCVAAPLRRTPVQGSGGTAGCSGAFAFDFNALVATGKEPSLAAFSTVYAQYWFLDPAAPGGSGTSDALQFVIHP